MSGYKAVAHRVLDAFTFIQVLALTENTTVLHLNCVSQKLKVDRMCSRLNLDQQPSRLVNNEILVLTD